MTLAPTHPPTVRADGEPAVTSQLPVLELGARIEFTHTLCRTSSRVDKAWEKTWLPFRLVKPKQGLVIGMRTLANGENRTFGYDEPISFRPRSYVKAYLIAFDLRRKPVLVLREHITTQGEDI